jgi:CRP-like cAMP-binding protein
MLSGKPRTATIQAKTNCELYCLTRTNAARVLKTNKEILNRLKRKMDERAKETADISKSFDEARNTLGLV